MSSLSRFLQQMDWLGLIILLFSVAGTLVCITFHELAHGYMAYRLGDPTAKAAGRLTLNPIRHIDPIGLLMMVTVGVGWAKPVPVNMGNFKHPKQGMALTALAGPLSNFIVAWIVLLISNGLVRILPQSYISTYVILFFLRVGVLSIGLGIFNLIPVPPLDGSRILFALLPDRIYYTVMRYERYIMLAMLALVWFGLFQRPLSFLIQAVARGLCVLSGFPFELLAAFFF